MYESARSKAAKAIGVFDPVTIADLLSLGAAALELAPRADDWPTVAAARAEIMAKLKALGAV